MLEKEKANLVDLTGQAKRAKNATPSELEDDYQHV